MPISFPSHAPPLPAETRAGLLAGLAQDVAYACRRMRAGSGLSAVVVLMLAAGLGANVVLLSALDAVVLHPTRIVRPDRVMMLWSWRQAEDATYGSSIPDYRDWAARNTVFDELCAFGPKWSSLRGAAGPMALSGFAITRNYFSTFGRPPILGRTFTAGEAASGGPAVVILSHAIWRTQFGADRAIIGRTVQIDGRAHTIVGVADAAMEYRADFQAEIYVPLAIDGEIRRGIRSLWVFGRLKPGRTRAEAEAQMRTIAAGLERDYRDSNTGWSVKLVSLPELLFKHLRWTVVVLYGAVAAVLLVVCLNLATIFLARAGGRRHEIAVRVALGAERARLYRQLLVESVVLAMLGGGLGLLLARAGRDLTRAFVMDLFSTGVKGEVSLALGPGVLAVAFGLTVFAGLFIGIVPARRVLGLSPIDALRPGAVQGARRAHQRHGFDLLVAAEIGVAVVLLTGAGLLVRSVDHLFRVDRGFTTSGIVAFEIVRPGTSQAPLLRQADATFFSAAMQRLRALPGVAAAEMVTFHPFGGNNFESGVSIEGRTVPPGGRRPTAEIRQVSLGYFSMMRIPLVRGRLFDRSDTASRRSVVVDREFVRRYFPGEDPIGRRINVFTPMEIVGVVGSIRWSSLRDDRRTPHVYELMQPASLPLGTVLVKTAGDPGALVRAARRAIEEVDPNQPIFRVKTLDAYVEDSIAIERLTARGLGVSAWLALALAIVGIWGVVAYRVGERRREIGVRVALGAQRRDVLGIVLRQAGLQIIVGLVAGLAASAALSRVLSSLLYRVSPVDPITFAVVAVVLGATTCLAAYLPARRALALDPAAVLRHE